MNDQRDQQSMEAVRVRPSALRLRQQVDRAFAAAEHRAARDRAHRQWMAGALSPYRITDALDAEDLYGPEVDIACGAVEPAVDEWEAGNRYPSFEQLIALAALTGRAPDTFVARLRDLDFDIRDTTMWGHMTKADRARWHPPIVEFTTQSVEECPGTDDYNETHLF